MKQIITKDGSITYHNEKYDEAYHSITMGAVEEAIEKYVKPAQIKPGFKVLDFCFGLGYNSLAVLELINDVEIVGIELDQEIIENITKINVPDKYKTNFEIIKELARNKIYAKNNLKMNLIMGDAMKVIKDLYIHGHKFDVILFDPFSPKKHPEMWSLETFSNIAKICKPGARLTTYSCARVVRDNLKAAGFSVIDGPIIGRRAPSTIAIY